MAKYNYEVVCFDIRQEEIGRFEWQIHGDVRRDDRDRCSFATYEEAINEGVQFIVDYYDPDITDCIIYLKLIGYEGLFYHMADLYGRIIPKLDDWKRATESEGRNEYYRLKPRPDGPDYETVYKSYKSANYGNDSNVSVYKNDNSTKREREIFEWLINSKYARPHQKGQGFYVLAGHIIRLKCGETMDLLDFLIKEGFNDYMYVKNYSVKISEANEHFQKKISFFYSPPANDDDDDFESKCRPDPLFSEYSSIGEKFERDWRIKMSNIYNNTYFDDD